MSTVLAIDAGQTGIKVRVGGQDLVFPGIDTHEELLPQLAAVVRAALDRTGAETSVVTAGVSGLTTREADAAALLARIDDPLVSEVTLAHDSTTSFLGALGDTRGAVVAAGTGVVTLAVGATAVARVDGWGYLMGDAGSGYWIGREALDAVMREFDGRGPATALTGVALERWPDLTQAYIDLQGDHERVRVVASFAEQVARLAAEGDAVSQHITVRAGGELAHSVETALRRVRTDDAEHFSVCAIGGVFRSPQLREAFASHIAASEFDVALVEPRGHGIDGAVALAGLGPRHPLAPAVWSARR
ncbi:N-acetylglucosamine kinase [Microbacterium kyungheense]|uniref:N-acetylglucosamine kinase-like BadF-type ATPase n=1 Tax=Microbacterium kyungheense TaxID=1263636 RepID=A0A543FKJ2_9MICO|nr:BadF/BadG/BcrA/BcrD ATPase family protein [Microbacterium kyungheense]TQM34345.1 N-acetylglucosamine kinase-like BadF-type ATPase [Microbacterium kyungheense]